MNCPKCGSAMKQSPVVVMTNPVTVHWICPCGVIVDQYRGGTKICREPAPKRDWVARNWGER